MKTEYKERQPHTLAVSTAEVEMLFRRPASAG